MSSFVQNFYPWWHLWLQGWRDLWASIPWVGRPQLFERHDGGHLAWGRGGWANADRGSVCGRLLDPSKVLWRQLRLPVMPPAQVAIAVESEVLVATPFPVEQTRHGCLVRTTADGLLMVDIAIVHLREVGAGLPVFARGENGPVPMQKAARSMDVWVTGVLLGCCVVMLLAYLAVPLVYYRQKSVAHILAFNRLAQSTSTQQQLRETVQTQLQQYQAVTGLVESYADPLLVLERVSDAIPDHTSLTQFKIQERQISIEGQTPNALELVNLLQSKPGFVNVQLSGAVQRHPQTGKDLFQIQMRFQP